VLRTLQNVRCCPLLDNFAALHDGDVVGNGAHRRKVVRDKHITQAIVALHPLQQRQDVFRDDLVKRARDFVTDDELRFGGQRTSNADALLLSAR